MKTFLLLILLGLCSSFAHAQVEGKLLPILVVAGDTFPTCTLQEVVVVTKRSFANSTEQSRFNQLKRNVMIVYPYAREAGDIFREVNEQLATLDKKKLRKKYIKEREQELDDLYEHSLKNMTITQGEILVKLIARETGMSVYDLIREFKNPTSAFYWNKISSLYGYSLKDKYDPQQDRDLEMIVRSIEGTL